MAFDWKSLVKSIAPSIGTALGGPLGGIAGLALTKALGISETSAKDDGAIAAAIQGASPDQLLNLKKADQDFALQMQKLGFEDIEALEAIAAGDRANARDREVKTQDWVPKALAVSISLAGYMMNNSWGLVGAAILPFFKGIVRDARETVKTDA